MTDAHIDVHKHTQVGTCNLYRQEHTKICMLEPRDKHSQPGTLSPCSGRGKCPQRGHTDTQTHTGTGSLKDKPIQIYTKKQTDLH